MERKTTEINDDDVAVFVRARTETEKLNIDIGYLTETVIPIDQLAHLLAAGIGVCIKSCTYNDMGIKDYELVEEIIIFWKFFSFHIDRTYFFDFIKFLLK